MRANRLLAALILLQLRGRMTAEMLASELEVSVRTIYRDIEELSAAGIPVYSDRGPQGGFQLLDGYRTRLTGLTIREASALLVVGLPSAASDLGLSDHVTMARAKLLAAISPEAGEAAARVGARLRLDLVDWYKRRQTPEQLTMVAQAVWESRRLRFRYKSWAGWREIVAEPLGLVLKAGTWYLVARVSESTRTYKVARSTSVEVTDEPFEYPIDFNLGKYWSKQIERFERELLSSTATLRASPNSLPSLDLLGAAMAEPLLGAEADASGWHQAEVPIESVAHAARLILGFGGDIEVIEPAELRAELSLRAFQIVKLYG